MKRRIYTLRVRLLPEEAEHVRRTAADLGLGLSDFVRRKVLGAKSQIVPRKTSVPAELLDLVRELGPIGNNLNQLVRHAHSGTVDSKKLNAALDEIRHVFMKFLGFAR